MKNIRGVTLISLTITIIVLLIIASIGMSYSMNSVETAKLAKFASNIEILNSKVSILRDEGKYQPNYITYDITDETLIQQINELLDSQLTTYFGITSENIDKYKSRFKYYSEEILKRDWQLDGIESNYIINIRDRIIISLDGVKYREKTYYSLEQLEEDGYATSSYKPEYEFKGKKFEKNTKLKLAGKNITIPAGATVSGISGEYEHVDDGIVIYFIPDEIDSSNWTDSDWIADTNKNGIIDVQENYNQFVWVPVSKENFATEFVRHDFGNQGWADDRFINTEPTESKNYEPNPSSTAGIGSTQATIDEVKAMYESVQLNQGFYIARYEAGTTNKRSRGDAITTDVVSKKGANVYNLISWSSSRTMNVETGGAVEVARSMYPDHSTLCYGVQWDAVMRWISKDNSLKRYLTDSTGKGNYWDNDSTNNPATTGKVESYQMKNIYDIAGNVREWTMEAYGIMNIRISRGGGYSANPDTNPVSYRYGNNSDYSNNDLGFRVAFYI